MSSGGWLETSNVLAKWSECVGQGAACDASKFADSALALISVFDLINGMSIASGDMKGNATTIKNLAVASPGSTLQSLVDAEMAGKDETFYERFNPYPKAKKAA